MIHLMVIALFNYLIINNATWNSTNSTSGLLQNINGGLSADEPVPGQFANPLGSALVILVFVLCAGIAALKIDLPLAGAFGSLIAAGTALILQTPGLALVGNTLPYIFGGLTVMFIFIALLAGTKSPFR